MKPAAIRNVIIKLFSIRFLRRWQPAVIALGDNMVATSVELRKKRFCFWLEVFGGTALSWTSRYMVVNAIFMAFLPATVNFADQWLILARQFVVWVVFHGQSNSRRLGSLRMALHRILQRFDSFGRPGADNGHLLATDFLLCISGHRRSHSAGVAERYFQFSSP